MSLEEKVDALVMSMATIQSDVKQVKTDTHTIRRGMYGDPENKVPGLIERQAADETDIKSLKEGRKKLIWIVAGFTLAVQIIFAIIELMK